MKKVLIIEDEPQMRKNIVTILQMEGFETLPAEDGRTGLERARRDQPDLVICDVMMPEMDGYAVLQALRAEPELEAVPFLFLTAKGERSDVRAGMNLGADDYLIKPVRRADLLAAVNTRLARAASRTKSVFKPNFSSSKPLEALGLTPREAEVLLWISQGKSNADIGIILNTAESTVKKHAQSIFEKLGLESRSAATLRALEALSS
jgi:DNA-binding NarL/FixJ family response regulator